MISKQEGQISLNDQTDCFKWGQVMLLINDRLNISKKYIFLVWTKKTMLSENADVIKIGATGWQTLDREHPKWWADATMGLLS